MIPNSSVAIALKETIFLTYRLELIRKYHIKVAQSKSEIKVKKFVIVQNIFSLYFKCILYFLK